MQAQKAVGKRKRRALLTDDLKAMNAYMNRVALVTFSFSDTGKEPLGAAFAQIEDRKYEATPAGRGIPTERIRKYGFAP